MNIATLDCETTLGQARDRELKTGQFPASILHQALANVHLVLT